MSHLTDFERGGRITASVVPAILRSDPYHSRKWAWRVTTGREPLHPPGPDAKRGLDHEEDAIEQLEVSLGKFSLPGRFCCHPILDWLGASPDSFIFDDSSGLEIPVEAKCPRQLHTVVPANYYDQMQTQLECCDAPYGYFVSWVEDGQWVKKVERDAQWWKKNYPILKDFYEQYVLADIEPPISPRRKKDGTQIQDKDQKDI